MVVVEDYCRQVEAYLCRKNDGHLIRIVGPAFEQVCGWASKGVPLTVAMRGIDRYFDRYYAKGPRRRPVRVEFCEADVLDVFDEWRRALGIARVEADGSSGDADAAEPRRQHSLPSHLERVVARLTARRVGEDRSLDGMLESFVNELDTMRASAKHVRGDTRTAMIERLRAIDRALLDAAYAQYDADARQILLTEADEELAPFRSRMTADAYEQSRRAAVDRLVRERGQLPLVSFE